MPDSLPPPSASPQTALDWARFYAALGWSVVPVRRGEKMPAERWARFQSLPADSNQILAWFADNPHFGVGLIQGSRAGTIVLDFDASSGGMETLADLDAQGLPASVRAFTPGGGVHVVLRHPGAYVPTRKGVRPGMDVRGDGGFIVAAPSYHANGRQYAWDVDCHPEDAPVADCPEWLVAIICGEAPAQPGTPGDVVRVASAGPLGLAVERVTDGREQYMRDTILAVCRDIRDTLGRLPTEAELIEAAWPQYAAHVDLSRPGRGRDEFAAKVRYTLARVAAGRVKGVAAAPEQPSEPGQTGQTGHVPADVPAVPASPLPLVYFDDVAPNLDVADFVEGLLTTTAMSVVYGPSNCGKTFFMSDLALHVAAGWAWRGREIDAGGVIYCALEGGHGIANRVAAFKQHHGILGGLPFAIVPVAINLLDPAADREKLVQAVRIAAERMGVPVKLIVVDTLSRALAGGNENAPDDMGALVASADYIRQAVQAHICFIHHSGKDQAQGARGHSLLRAATDTEIEISRPDTSSPSVAKVTKQRDLEIEGQFVFKLTKVELGQNRRGKPVTSCVVEAVDASLMPVPVSRLPDGARHAMNALHHALIEAGRLSEERDIPAGTRVAPIDAWRREFYARSHHETQEARKKAFQRAVKDLLGMGAVGLIHDLVWDAKAAGKAGQGAGT